MALIAWVFALATTAPQPVSAALQEARLSALAAEVLSADYRGDRPALARFDDTLGRLDAGTLREYRDYWRGFARWRRALNGFNETPTPSDLRDDLETAIGRFRDALARRPDWLEPKIGIVGSTASLLYLAGKDDARKKALLAEYMPFIQTVQKDGLENPRALWLIGGFHAYGGDTAKAIATHTRGLAAAWREKTAEPPAPAWAPTWGGPENLMNLAYITSHGDPPNKGLALAYAQGAATSAPEWHYVRDILLPQIQALPEAASDGTRPAAASCGADAPPGESKKP
jgi:hypothetical protein